MIDKIIDSLKVIAPGIATLIAGPEAGAIVAGLSNALLGKPDATHDELYQRMQALSPDDIVKIKELETQAQVKLAELQAQTEQADIQADVSTTEQVNATMQVEDKTEDKFKTYWRPTFGYAFALNWTILMTGFIAIVFYAIVKQPSNAAAIINNLALLMGAITPLMLMALRVLGVNIRERSKDKAVAAGVQPTVEPGVFQSLIGAISKKS